jgi:hypothetical protein
LKSTPFAYSAQDVELLATDIALQASNDFDLALSFFSSPFQILPAFFIVSESNNHHPMNGGVGVSFAAPVAPMGVSFTSCSRDGTYPA